MESWPEFRITQYVVTRADGSALANPLLKEYEGRCIIRGRVEVDGDNRDWRTYGIIKKTWRRTQLTKLGV